MDAKQSENIRLHPLQRFFRLLQNDKKEIIHVYIYALFNGLIYLSLPLGIQAIIGLIQGAEVSSSWIVLVVFVIVGIGFSGLLQMTQLRITENLERKIFARSAFEFAFRIPRIKPEALYQYYPPELVNRFFDTLSVQKGLSKILMDFSTATLQVFFGLILLSLYHPFFIIFGTVLLLLLFIIFKVTSGRGLRASIQESKHKYEVAHWLEELARTIGTFRLAGNSDLPLKKADDYVENYLNARETHFNVLYLQFGFLVIFKVIIAAGLLLAGGLLVFKQQMNIGQFVAAEIVILMIMSSVEKLILSLDTIYDVLTALEKIGQVTDLPLEVQDGLTLEDIKEDDEYIVESKEVDFSYPHQNGKTLNNVSFKLRQGQNLFITGPSSAGKTSILQLLAGLFIPGKGAIFINGISLSRMRTETIREITGDFMSQQVLFNGSLYDNITVGREGLELDDVNWAIEKSGLSTYLKNLPKGLRTIILPEGRQLPRSVIQKILLARAIAPKPKLLLIEDMFDAITWEEKKNTIAFLTSQDAPWSLIVSSQDKRWCELCNKTIVLEDGEVIFEGNHQSFVKTNWYNKNA